MLRRRGRNKGLNLWRWNCDVRDTVAWHCMWGLREPGPEVIQGFVEGLEAGLATIVIL